MPYITRRVAFAAKKETNPGTAETLDFATDAIRILGAAEPEAIYIAPNETGDVMTGKLGRVSLAGSAGRGYRFQARAALIGAGVAYDDTPVVVPEIHPILLGMGYAATITPEATPGDNLAKVDYDLADTAVDSLTCQLWLSGKLYKIFGAKVESAVLTCTAGGFPILEFAVVGAAVDPAETAWSAPTFDNVTFPIWKGTGSLAVGGHGAGLVGRSMRLDFGLEVADRGDCNQADALAGFELVRRLPTWQVVVEVPALSTYDPWTDAKNKTARALTAVFAGDAPAGSYRTITASASDARANGPGIRDRDDRGVRVYEVPYDVNIPASGNEMRLTFSD